MNINNNKTFFFDFFSFPNNPEELFTILYPIGKNSNYEIYKAIYNQTREVFCIKIIPLIENENKKITSKFIFKQLNQETLLMKSIKNCENITQYYGSFFSLNKKNIWLIYEYCSSGSIYDIMKILDRTLTEKEISIIMNDILHGLIFLHQLNIIHRNIKSTNILLSEKGISKLNNLSKSIQQLNNISEGTYTLESNNNEELNDTKYDIFLLGITCIELFMGLKDNSFDRKQFIDGLKNNNASLKELLEKNISSTNNKSISKVFYEFIQKCIELNHYKRPTAYELSNHPFIKKTYNSSEKLIFINEIRYNIEKIENYKKVNYISSKKSFGIYNSIYSNTKNTLKKSINNKSSLNISNLINYSNNNNDIDKIAEFKIKQFEKGDEIIENDNNKSSNKDLYSNIDNTAIKDDSLNYTLKESATFYKGEQKENNKEYEIQKKSLLSKNILENYDNKNKGNTNINIERNIDNINEKEKINNKKDNNKFYFKENLEHLNKYEEIFKASLSDNNTNYNYNTHILQFNEYDDVSLDINNNIDNNYNNDFNELNISQGKYIPFTEIKCDIIQLGASIKKRPSKNSNYTSEYSLKNSFSKFGESNCFDSKDNNVINIKKNYYHHLEIRVQMMLT